MPVLLDDLRGRFDSESVIVSPDAGGVERARAYSKRLGASLAIIDKRRPAPNVAEVVNIIGDVKGRDAIIVDDMIDTAGTLLRGRPGGHEPGRARGLRLRQPRRALGPGDRAHHRARRSRSSSSPTPSRRAPTSGPVRKIKVLSVARLLGEAIKRIHHGDSISSLFI